MSSTLVTSSITVLALALCAAAPAEGQLSGLKNRAKKAVESVTGDGAAATPAQAAAAYNEHVLEMTPDIVERFGKALRAEEAERQEIERIAASVRTPEAYQACVMTAVATPESEALMAAMAAKGEAYLANTADAAAAAAHREAQQDVMDFMVRSCGPDPDQFRSSELPKLQARPAKVGQEAGGFTVTQYAILKERVAPLCGLAEAAGADGVRIPGEGENIYWVYSPAEVETLVPRCAELTRLVADSL